MKKLIYGILMAVIACGIVSCRNEYDPLDDGNYRIHGLKNKHVMKTVSMSFGGDYIAEAEEPLLRAEDGGHTYKAVSVYWTEDKEGATEKPYAYGLFKDREQLDIDLFTGFKYRFEATIVIDDVDKVELCGDYSDSYANPFQKRQFGTISEEVFKSKDLNAFIYVKDESAPRYLYQLSEGRSYVDIAKDRDDSTGKPIKASLMRFPRLKRFYGTLDNFVVAGDNRIVTISMGYKTFGLEIVVDYLPFGSITVEAASKQYATTNSWQDSLLFTRNLLLTPVLNDADENSKSQYKGIYSMHSMTAESATFNFTFKWNKGEGLRPKTIEKEVVVHPKMNKILRLNVDGTANESKSGNIVLVQESEDMQDEEMDISYSDK